jgi:hypothetical protein
MCSDGSMICQRSPTKQSPSARTSVWFQLGLEHPDAAATAVAAGLDVVQNRCLKIEHARFRGGLHTAGFNTGVIDSRRARLV